MPRCTSGMACGRLPRCGQRSQMPRPAVFGETKQSTTSILPTFGAQTTNSSTSPALTGTRVRSRLGFLWPFFSQLNSAVGLMPKIQCRAYSAFRNRLRCFVIFQLPYSYVVARSHRVCRTPCTSIAGWPVLDNMLTAASSTYLVFADHSFGLPFITCFRALPLFLIGKTREC